MKCRYTIVAAQKLTKTVIETAIAGGGGLVDTLRHSYSMNDLPDLVHMTAMITKVPVTEELCLNPGMKDIVLAA